MEIKITDPDGNVLDSIIVPDTVDIAESNEVHNTSIFLSPAFCHSFREAVNSSPIFWRDSKYMKSYHLCCAVMDRLDTCIEKLNKYGDYPDSEEDFLVFMMFASMATDAVKEILSQLGIHKRKIRYMAPKMISNISFHFIFRQRSIYSHTNTIFVSS